MADRPLAPKSGSSGTWCGWCMVRDCAHCKPGGVGWHCSCTHEWARPRREPEPDLLDDLADSDAVA